MEVFVGSTVNQEPYNNVCDPVSSFSCFVSSSRQYQEITHLVDIPPANFKCNSEEWSRNDWILSRYWSPDDGVGGLGDLTSHQLTYGEVTPLGVRQLAYGMDISFANCNDGDEHDNENENDNNLIISLEKNKNADDDDEFYFIKNPALGLWAVPDRFEKTDATKVDDVDNNDDETSSLSPATKKSKTSSIER